MSQQINLYNPVFLKQKHYFSAVTMVQALAAVLVGAMLIYAFELRQTSTLARVLAEADKQALAQRDQLLKLSKDYSAQGASLALTEELARAESRLQLREGLLGELKSGVGGNAEGFSRYLGALARQSTPGVWLTGLEVGAKDRDLVIKGRALESRLVPAYIRSLHREAAMAGRAIGDLRMTAKGDAAGAALDKAGEPAHYIEFSLSIPLKEKS